MHTNLINGISTPELSSGHRMVAFGDGLFETCYVEQGRIRFRPAHMERLEHGLSRLQMNWSANDRQLLEAEVDLALGQCPAQAVCKILVGRNVVGRGYDFDPATQRTDRIVQISQYQAPQWRHRGADLVISDIPASLNPALAGIKHLNRLDSVLARQSARRVGADEALMTLTDGRLVEGSMSNVYIRFDGQWITPPLSQAGVNGIVRRRLLQQNVISVSERECFVDELQQAEAMLISNALLGLVPVRSLDQRPLPKPDGDELLRLCTAIGIRRD